MQKNHLVNLHRNEILNEEQLHKKYIEEVLFDNKKDVTITSSPEWTSEFLDWSNEEYDSQKRKMSLEEHCYEIIQGTGSFEGELLGGCLEVYPMFDGTSIWPQKEEWKNKILFLEKSEDEVSLGYV